MTSKTISFEQIHNEYCAFIDSCGKTNFYTRAKSVQKQKVAECESYIQIIKNYKMQAVARNDEGQANQLFHMQCMINAARSVLLMWLELKDGAIVEAWSNLIDSQEYTSVALKLEDYLGVRDFESRLKNIEVSVFPNRPHYCSSGFVETIGMCSICRAQFLDCEHIENQIYMGAMCQRIQREIIEMDHVSLVEYPRDRRCIITTTSDDQGKTIDYFTLESSEERLDGIDNRHIGGIALSSRTLDFT